MKKLDLEKKVLKYTSVAGSVAAFAGVANAQVMYTDVNPDQTFSEDQFYMLDVNNDATDDFMIAQFDTTISYGSFTFPAEGVVVLTSGSNGLIGTSGQIPYLKALNFGDPISVSQSFTQSTSSSPLVAGGYVSIPFGGYPIGPWIDGADHYMGLTFLIGANFHYGWCRMTVGTDGKSFTVKDYAYDATAQTGINAGQGASSVEEDISNDISINVANNSVQISILNSNLTNGQVELVALNGQLLSTETLNGNKSIDLNGYASGVYFVKITFDQGQMVRKLFVR